MFSQQLDDDIQRLMDAGGNDHLAGVAIDRARDAQIFGHRFTQRQVAAGLAIGQQIGARTAPVLVLQAAPYLVREQRHIRHAGHECAPLQIADARVLYQLRTVGGEFRLTAGIGQRRIVLADLGNLIRRGICNEGAGTCAGLQIAFCDQLFVGVGHGVAR